VHGKQPCDLHEKARDQAHQQQNSGKNNQRISIASPILTGVGMPVWKAAKMRAFSKHRSATGFVWNSAFASEECLYLCSKKAPCGAFLFGIAPRISILADTYR
jgi:hypothetical protein